MKNAVLYGVASLGPQNEHDYSFEMSHPGKNVP